MLEFLKDAFRENNLPTLEQIEANARARDMEWPEATVNAPEIKLYDNLLSKGGAVLKEEAL